MRTLACILLVLAVPLLIYGQDPAGWDDVHFESGSAALVATPALLSRLASVLLQHRDYRVQLTGSVDSLEARGGKQGLGLQRAEAAGVYLARMGVNATQITTQAAPAGPATGNETAEGRFRNRRVAIVVRDERGGSVGDFDSGNDILNAMQDFMKKSEESTAQTLKRLDKLDDLLAAAKGIQGDNDRLKAELSDLRNHDNMLRDQIASLPKPLTEQQTQALIRNAVTGGAEAGPVWAGGLSGRAFLISKETEDKRFGLYSYLLIPTDTVDTESDLKKRYIAALDAYQAKIVTLAELQNQKVPPPFSRINITYLPLQFMPEKITSENLLRANNRAVAETLLQLLREKHQGVEGRDGPFLVSYLKPLTGTKQIGEHLFLDMSGVPAEAISLYMRAFLTQAGRERYWEKDHNQWILDCYAFIENAGVEFESVAKQYKDKSFLSTIFGWFKP
jgi:hypothetical protein